MSTRWGYKCETCNEESPHWWNHADEELAVIAKQWPTIKPVYELFQKRDIWHIRFTFPDLYDHPDPLDFLDTHDGHVIVLHNEYNDTKALT